MIIDHVAPPGLHILDLGPPNVICRKLDELVPSVSLVWKRLGCVRDPLNDKGYDGNTVRRIMNHTTLRYEVVPPEYQDLVYIFWIKSR